MSVPLRVPYAKAATVAVKFAKRIVFGSAMGQCQNKDVGMNTWVWDGFEVTTIAQIQNYGQIE